MIDRIYLFLKKKKIGYAFLSPTLARFLKLCHSRVRMIYSWVQKEPATLLLFSTVLLVKSDCS